MNPNKRKSVAKATTTPNKIQKLASTPQKNSKSPKSANKINAKEVNGNRGPKSSKINQKNKTNGAKITPKGKKPKQIEEEEIDDSDELNGSDISNDAADSDNEDAQIGISDSDDDVEADSDNDVEADSDNDVEADSDNDVEADSDDEAEVEHADSDEPEVDEEADSDKNAENDNEADSEEENCVDERKNKGEAINEKEFSVVVKGLTTKREIDLFFHDCNIVYSFIIQDHRTQLPSEFSRVIFKDKESFEKALEKDGKEVNGCIVTVRKRNGITKFSVLVKGLGRNVILKDLFTNCNISWRKFLPLPHIGRALVCFEDKESLERALENNLREFQGRVIAVERVEMSELEIKKCTRNLTALVTGIKSELKLKDILKNFKVRSYKMIRNNGQSFVKCTFVDFEDEESLQKALLLHKTEYDGCVLKITRKYCDIQVENINSESDINAIFKNCNIQSIELENISGNNKRAVVSFKDPESFKKAFWKNNTEFKGKTIKVNEVRNLPSENNSYSKKSNHSRTQYKPIIKKNFSSKELLLQQLKKQAEHLEREINK